MPYNFRGKANVRRLSRIEGHNLFMQPLDVIEQAVRQVLPELGHDSTLLLGSPDKLCANSAQVSMAQF